jgi:hypothetical protein
MRAIELGTKFIVETLSHAKDKGSLPSYVSHLKTLYSRHVPASRVRLLFLSLWRRNTRSSSTAYRG